MQYVVGIGEMKVAGEKDSAIITYALGSCLGISVYDPVAKVGGLLHAMLPLSTIDPKLAGENPYKFVDTGVPRLFEVCYQYGAEKRRMEIKVAGGASTAQFNGNMFEIGKRNFLVLRKLLWKNNLLIKSYDVGGAYARTMQLDINSGTVAIKANGQVNNL